MAIGSATPGFGDEPEVDEVVSIATFADVVEDLTGERINCSWHDEDGQGGDGELRVELSALL